MLHDPAMLCNRQFRPPDHLALIVFISDDYTSLHLYLRNRSQSPLQAGGAERMLKVNQITNKHVEKVSARCGPETEQREGFS
jgi:hypothetical protein